MNLIGRLFLVGSPGGGGGGGGEGTLLLYKLLGMGKI